MLDKPRIVPALWALGLFVTFGLVGAWINADGPALHAVDDLTSSWSAWQQGHPWVHTTLLLIETFFGTGVMSALLLGLAVWLIYRKHLRAALFALVTTLTSVAVTHVLKRVWDRPRPEWQDPDNLFAAATSFPSGHIANNAAVASLSVVLVLMFVRRHSLRRAAYVAIALTELLIIVDRLALGRHHLSDAVGSLALGIGIALAATAAVNPLPKTTASQDLHPSGRKGRLLAVVLNPVKVEDLDTFTALVTSMALEAGYATPQWWHTTTEDPGTGMALAARDAGAELVIVCGGDGTVREVCAALAGTGLPVGIVPAGTGNLLARNLDLPLFLRSAIDVALTGRDKAIDLVSVSGDDMEPSSFMVMAGMGMDAAIMEGVNEEIKKKVGWMAYVVSATKSLASPALKVEISVDDGPYVLHRARTVVVGNVGYLQAGMPLLPDATIDDGLLDVVILNPQRLASWGKVAARVVSRGKRTDDVLNRIQAAKVCLRTPTPTPRQLDGDIIGVGHELVMECQPGRVTVRVPR